jgi:phytoene synthase
MNRLMKPMPDPRTMPRLQALIAEAAASPEDYFARNSRSFSFAARLFPAEARRDITQVYAFCRLTDDLVDLRTESDRPDLASAELEAWERMARRSYQGEPSGVDFLDEIMARSAQAGVPFSWIEELIAGVRSDLGPVEIQDWEDLRRYCYRVASVIGLWISRLFGVEEPWLLERAEMLGYAMQLTNILRDVGEDLRMERVYLPREALLRHGLQRSELEAMAAGAPISPSYRALQLEMMVTAERCYELAFEAMPHLPAFYARPVAAAAEIYRGILGRLQAQGFDNLNRRARTHDLVKPWLATRGLARLGWPLRRPRSEVAPAPPRLDPSPLPLHLQAFTGPR